MAVRDDLLRLPAGDRLAVYSAARRRADARLRLRYEAEYEAILNEELANPPAVRQT